jgi:hypothetical protein
MLGGVSVGSFLFGKQMKTKTKKSGFGLFCPLLRGRDAHGRIAFFAACVAIAK